MVAIQNQQTDLLVFLSINGTEITEHGRKFSSSEFIQTADVETATGRLKRYYKNNKKTLSLSFNYLPSSSEKTVDGRVGRDFIENLARTSPVVLISYLDKPGGSQKEFYGFISSYSEQLIRRDLSTQCSYYDVSFQVDEK